MPRPHAPKARTPATSLCLNADSLGVERARPHALSAKQREQWLAENREAIDAYADYVEKHGVFSTGLRRF